MFQEPSGKACNGYELWREDLDLARRMGLNAYRFSVEWARVEPVEGEFSDEALDHYEAIVDGCLERGLAPVVTFNHFTLAALVRRARAAGSTPRRPRSSPATATRSMERFGDRIAYAVTLNEPNLARLLTWSTLPDFVRELERATLGRGERGRRRAERTGWRTSCSPRRWTPWTTGMTAGHLAARAAIKARRPTCRSASRSRSSTTCVVGDDPSVRDRKRAEVYERWLELARDDDFVGVQNYEQVPYDGDGEVPPAARTRR